MLNYSLCDVNVQINKRNEALQYAHGLNLLHFIIQTLIQDIELMALIIYL
jgi:hypothetical protein